ncbi:alpha/beta hydrolase [Nocardia sp. NBC_01730]|uniref:alpha/beta hydrolase n=1 Tax=Nocardia sp. NBC_01730 TaxID=2975998 RepID=UPI002E10743B|nr:alpha/beta hydrolase [Nocardia sp. NBC_01730]
MTTVRITTDLEFARVDDVCLTLDIYRPTSQTKAVPVVLYLHGGGWQVGDKTDGAKERLTALAERGIAIASANYRFVGQGLFPAQIHDTKAAVRWLRANGATHGLATDRIGIWGASAGAVLASLTALTAGDSDFEGTVGDHPEQSSAVDVAVHWFGQTDLLANSARSWLERDLLKPPFEAPLFGVDDLTTVREEARAASPLTRVHADAPPFLIAHGDRDRITPASESVALHDALVRAGAESTLLMLGGAGHEGPEFDRPDHLSLTAAFLAAHLHT